MTSEYLKKIFSTTYKFAELVVTYKADEKWGEGDFEMICRKCNEMHKDSDAPLIQAKMLNLWLEYMREHKK